VEGMNVGYFSVFTYAARAETCAGVSVLIGLMCGAFASPPLVRTSTTFDEPEILGAIGDLPCP